MEDQISRSHEERLFDILRANLVATHPEHEDADHILCPLCLRPMTVADVKSVEHIIPSNTLKDDPDFMRAVPLSYRAGLTVLCRESRDIGGKSANQGCNGFKGSTYDRLFNGMMQGRELKDGEVWNRHTVAVLTMAYLAAFQQHGYGYILDDAFEPIRRQFDRPDDVVTDWMHDAHIWRGAHDPNGKIWATSSGLPFVFGGRLTDDAPLEVFFRRFRARLSGGHWKVTDAPAVLLPQLLEGPAPTPTGSATPSSR